MESTLEIPDKILQIITAMEGRISRLEAKLQGLQGRYEELLMHSMREQNERARKDIQRIWGLDGNKAVDPKKLEGILADYPGPPNSADLVRSIRDDV